MGQEVDVPSSISINEYELEAVHKFAYLGSTITDSLSLDTDSTDALERQLPHSPG